MELRDRATWRTHQVDPGVAILALLSFGRVPYNFSEGVQGSAINASDE